MANQLLTISTITNEALMVLENQLTFARAVNRTYDSKFAVEGAKVGATVNVRRPPRYVGRTGAALNVENSIETYVPITLDTQFGVDISFTTADLALSVDDFSNRFIKPAMATVANKIDYSGLQLYKKVHNIVGTPGTLTGGSATQADCLNTVLAARRRLNEEAAPVDQNRSIVVDPAMEVALVQGFTTLFNPQGAVSEIFKQGALGDNVLGFNFAMDQNVPVHTAGTLNTTAAVNGAQAGGSIGSDVTTPFSVTITAPSATITVGSVVTIAGVYAVNPQSRVTTGVLKHFVVRGNGTEGTDIGASDTTMQILPVPIFSGQFQNVTSSTGNIANAAAITLKSGLNSNSYAQGMAFHKDAFALACADLDLPRGVDMASRASSKAAGLSVRAIRQYDINSDQMPMRLDVLFGWASIYPQLACRMSG